MQHRASAPLTPHWNHFDFTIEQGVGTVTFTRPDKLNPLTFDIYADLRDLLHELGSRDDVDVLVLRGQGAGFCSGGDVNEIIGELLAMDPRDLTGFTTMTGDVVEAMRTCPVPIIAGIQGMAAGAGSVLALAADFRVLAHSARFAFLFTKVGLSGGDMGSAYLLPRLVGAGRATELLMLGDTIDASQAERYGLASRLVADDDLDQTVAELARRLADGPTLAYSRTKASITAELDMALNPALGLDAMTQALLMKSGDHAEFRAAFNDGRRPQWTGR